MERVSLESTTQVFNCGGAITYQLLCGRDIAQTDVYAAKSGNYCYLVVNTHDRTAIAVDAAWDVDGIYALADKLGVAVKGSIYSHFHVDHCGGEAGVVTSMVGRARLPGAKEVQQRGGRVWAHAEDAEQIKKQCSLEKIAALQDGDVIDCGDLILHILHTPGHSPGSICIYAEPRCLSPRAMIGGSPLREEAVNASGGLLLTGDTLFVGACGRTDMPDAGMDPRSMSGSLARLSTMDPAVIVLPGHNYAPAPYTTIGQERAQNESVQFGMQCFPCPKPLPPCFVCAEAGSSGCGPSNFSIGKKIHIRGLESEAGKSLNGQSAVLMGYNSDKERYMVRMLSASETKVLKPLNLSNSPEAKPDSMPNTGDEKQEPRIDASAQVVTDNKDLPNELDTSPWKEQEDDAPGDGAATGPALEQFFDGVMSVECGETWARPWRLPHRERILYAPGLSAMAACTAVRMVFHTLGTKLRLVASSKRPSGVDVDAISKIDVCPVEYELFDRGKFFARKSVENTLERKHVVVFAGLPEGPKDLELWLPVNAAIVVHSADCYGEQIERPLADSRPIWLCHGSSITHGGPVACTPSSSWPAVCARLANLRLVNLGFGAECYLDQAVARAIRDASCDCISLKIGINIFHMTGLTARTFGPAVIGFVQTIRDGHPNTPLVLVSPIWCEMGETKAPISDSRFLTLAKMRKILDESVEALRELGDPQLFYRSGLDLLGQADQKLLWDGVHPTAKGYMLMGRRFAESEFGSAGRLLPNRAAQDLTQESQDIASTMPVDVTQQLLGPFHAVDQQGKPFHVMVKYDRDQLVGLTNRKDWPPAVLDVRGDFVFVRNVPGNYGRLQGSTVKFNNGISWFRPSSKSG